MEQPTLNLNQLASISALQKPTSKKGMKKGRKTNIVKNNPHYFRDKMREFHKRKREENPFYRKTSYWGYEMPDGKTLLFPDKRSAVAKIKKIKLNSPDEVNSDCYIKFF